MMGPELSYTSATSDTPLLGDTIGANFDRTAAAFPDRLALVDVPAGLRYTYAELKDEVDALAYALLGIGIAKGDRVGIWSPNRAEWTVTQYATAKIGAILVNINPAYRTSELEYVLNQSGCKLLIAAQRLKTSDYAAMIAEVRPRCPELDAVVLLGRPAPARPAIAVDLAAHRASVPTQNPRDRALRLAGCTHPANRHPLSLGELVVDVPHRNITLAGVLHLLREPKASRGQATRRSGSASWFPLSRGCRSRPAVRR